MINLFYRLLKIFFDGTGFLWKSKWTMDLKLAVNNQCSNYLIKLKQADDNSFAVLLRRLLIVISLALYGLCVLSINIGIFKTVAINAAFTASALMLYAIVVCSTTDEFWDKIKDVSKIVKWCFVEYLIIFIFALGISSFGQFYSNPVYVGKVLNEELFQKIMISQLTNMSVSFYVFSIVPFLIPFALLGIPFYVNRWLVFPLLRRLIAKAEKEPFKYLSFLLLVWSTIRYIKSNMFK